MIDCNSCSSKSILSVWSWTAKKCSNEMALTVAPMAVAPMECVSVIDFDKIYAILCENIDAFVIKVIRSDKVMEWESYDMISFAQIGSLLIFDTAKRCAHTTCTRLTALNCRNIPKSKRPFSLVAILCCALSIFRSVRFT